MQTVEGKTHCSADIIKLHYTNASMTLKSTQCLPAKATHETAPKSWILFLLNVHSKSGNVQIMLLNPFHNFFFLVGVGRGG